MNVFLPPKFNFTFLVFLVLIAACSSKDPNYIEVYSKLEKEEIFIHPSLKGKIKCFNAEIGDTVKEGELIATLDTSSLYQQKENLQSRLTKALGHLKKPTQNNHLPDESLESLISEIDYLNQKIKGSLLRAPKLGVIISRFAQEGDTVLPTQAIFKMHLPYLLKLQAALEKKEFSQIESQPFVEIELLEKKPYPCRITGKIEEIQQATDRKSSQPYYLKITIPNPKGQLLIGASVKVRFPKKNSSPLKLHTLAD